MLCMILLIINWHLFQGVFLAHALLSLDKHRLNFDPDKDQAFNILLNYNKCLSQGTMHTHIHTLICISVKFSCRCVFGRFGGNQRKARPSLGPTWGCKSYVAVTVLLYQYAYKFCLLCKSQESKRQTTGICTIANVYALIILHNKIFCS